MTPREAIDQAKERLYEGSYALSQLYKYGHVRVHVLPANFSVGPVDEVPSYTPNLYVEFVMEDNHCYAEYQGHKESYP